MSAEQLKEITLYSGPSVAIRLSACALAALFLHNLK